MIPSRFAKDVFFQYPLTDFKTSDGVIKLPILYYDNSICMSIYLVDYDKACSLVSDQRLQVVPVTSTKALVGVSFYEYRQTAIGSYNEVGVAILTTPRGVRTPRLPLFKLSGSLDKNPMGFHIIDLPVTTTAACSAGREVWGLPKFVTPIDFNLNGKKFKGAVQDPEGGQPIVSFSGQCLLSLPGPLFDLSLHSFNHNQLLRTLVVTRGGGRIMPGHRFKLTTNPQSKHPMAQRLRQLGLEQAKPIMVCASHNLQLRLNNGVAIMD